LATLFVDDIKAQLASVTFYSLSHSSICDPFKPTQTSNKATMKFFILLAVVASATAVPLAGVVNTGASAVSRSEDGLGNYAFGYNEDHATGGTFRKEKGGHGVQVGSYGLRDADGRVRTVNYVADALGFRASVSTNEPGVDVKQDPAAVNLNYGLHAGVPAPLALAPAVAAPVLAAPAYGAYGAGYGAPALAYGGGYAAAGLPLASYAWNTQHSWAAPVATVAAAPLGYGGYGGYGKY